MKNERITEHIVEAAVLNNDDADGCLVEYQQSADPTIRKLLKAASKSGGGGAGYPEFFVRRPATDQNLVIVYECKAETSKHESPLQDKVADFAVDGVLHYARALAKNFDVVAVAVSGQTAAELRVSTHKFLRGTDEALPLEDAHGPISRLAPFTDLAAAFRFDPAVHRRQHRALLATSNRLHHFLRDNLGLTEDQKPLLVSGVLIALTDAAFRSGYTGKSPNQLPGYLYRTLADVLEDADLPEGKRKAMLQPYSFITVHADLDRVPNGEQHSPLRTVIDRIHGEVWPYLATYGDVDVPGQFYGEFLKYAAGDGKGLGIVLTPRHITELFADLADVNPTTSVVLDACTGTGGYLIAAMQSMLSQANCDEQVIKDVKTNRLIGIEQQAHMFALAASNMILRGDGKANLYRTSCFDSEVIETIKTRPNGRPNVGLLNPPYSSRQADRHELAFIDNMLDMLAPGGVGIAIVPMSCAIAPNKWKTTLLSKHRLVAAMSMPDELFYPTATVTCILVFQAHQPHNPSIDTWFGYWKKDGFLKTKDKGRVDSNGQWEDIKGKWLDAFRNRREVPGQSVLASVTSVDEWCAEAYLETDYATLTESDFVDELRKFALFRLVSGESAEHPNSGQATA